MKIKTYVSLACLALSFSTLYAATSSLPFTVTLSGGDQVPMQAYPYPIASPAKQSDWGSFKSVTTYQFVTSSIPTGLKVTTGNYKCGEVFDQNSQTLSLLSKISIKDTSLPIHLTVIPFIPVTTDNCGSGIKQADATDALAIWISDSTLPANPPGAIECELPAGKFDVSKLPFKSNDCTIDKPKWQLTKDTLGKVVLRYTGTLYTMTSGTSQKPIVINVPLNTTVTVPLTTEYVDLPTTLSSARDPGCTAAIKGGDVSKMAAACKVNAKPIATSEAYQRSFTYSTDFKQPIYVQGFGRIDGADVIKAYASKDFPSGSIPNRPCSKKNNLGSIYACSGATQWLQYAEWRIATSMLGLSSGYQPKDASKYRGKTYQGSDPAISVTGVTVSNSPKRNRGVVQLNVAQFGVKGDRSANNAPVQMNDFKQVGVWTDASDGPDIGSDGSWMRHMYFHVNDDSVKIEAKHQLYQDATLLQGGVGGIILGMYGVTRDGIDGSLVDGVVVPRITEPTMPSKWDDYGSTHGLVSSRTCPRYFQNTEYSSSEKPPTSSVVPSIANATVKNVHVFALGGSAEPNKLSALISLGVADGYYCDTTFDTEPLAPQYVFGPLFLTNIHADVTPQEPFVFYNGPGSKTKVSWKPMVMCQRSGNQQVCVPWKSNSAPESNSYYVSTQNYLYPCGSNAVGNKWQCLTGASSLGLATTVTSNSPNITIKKASKSGNVYIEPTASAIDISNILYPYSVGKGAM